MAISCLVFHDLQNSVMTLHNSLYDLRLRVLPAPLLGILLLVLIGNNSSTLFGSDFSVWKIFKKNN